MYMGKEIRRDRRGRFSRGSKGIIAVAVIAVAFFIFNSHFNAWYEAETIEYVAPRVAYASISMEAKVEVLKEDILDRLMACESAGHSEEDGIIIFDSNNEPSIGQFQFQRDTVVHYYGTLYGKEITRKDAVVIAVDTEKARELAHDIIFGVQGGVFNWENCAESTGIVPEITVIKKLERDI